MTVLRVLPIITLLGQQFKNVRVVADGYALGGERLDLECEDGQPLTVVTKWIEGLHPGEVAIKDYGENEGLYAQLVEAGVIFEAHRYDRNGYCDFPICYLPESGGIPDTTQEQPMQAKALKEFISEQTGQDADDVELADYMTDDVYDELFETGSAEVVLNDDITIVISTHCEVVAKQPEDETATDF